MDNDECSQLAPKLRRSAPKWRMIDERWACVSWRKSLFKLWLQSGAIVDAALAWVVPK